MTLGQFGATMDSPNEVFACVPPRACEAKRDCEPLVDREYVSAWLETGNQVEFL
jgi:hypothetical protein